MVVCSDLELGYSWGSYGLRSIALLDDSMAGALLFGAPAVKPGWRFTAAASSGGVSASFGNFHMAEIRVHGNFEAFFEEVSTITFSMLEFCMELQGMLCQSLGSELL